MILWFNDNGNCLFAFSYSLITLSLSSKMMRCEGSDLKQNQTKRKKNAHIKILIVRLSRSMDSLFKFEIYEPFF